MANQPTTTQNETTSAEELLFPNLRYPITKPATSLWNLRISDAEYAKLKSGYWGKDDIDGKWSIHSKMDDVDNVTVSIMRTFTMECHKLHLSAGEDGAAIDSIIWDAEQNLPLKDYPGAPEQAKKEVVYYCRQILGCEFEGLPRYGNDILHHPGYRIRN